MLQVTVSIEPRSATRDGWAASQPDLDKGISLAIPRTQKPQRGPLPHVYYKRKHAAGEYGKYFLHHTEMLGK